MSRTVLISIHPRFVDLILKGEKRVEFRRIWAKQPVDQLVIYATSPVKRIVAVASVQKVEEASMTGLWNLAKEHGGGVTRAELREYFAGSETGFGIKLSEVRRLKKPQDPFRWADGFKAPQSFRYLTPGEEDLVLGGMGATA